jgi:hypothetical protein
MTDMEYIRMKQQEGDDGNWKTVEPPRVPYGMIAVCALILLTILVA